jgi:hypothetical protein
VRFLPSYLSLISLPFPLFPLLYPLSLFPSALLTDTAPFLPQWVLAIGVEEELLPGRRTALEREGVDVVSRKRQVESLLEEGRREIIGAVDDSADDLQEAGYAVGEAVDEETRRARKAAARREREERLKEGWKSPAFDLVVRGD